MNERVNEAIDNFLSTIKDELEEIKDLRHTLAVNKDTLEVEYALIMDDVHQAVGSRIPSQILVKRNRVENRSSLSKDSTRSVNLEQKEENNGEERHVYFDPEQDLNALLSFRGKRH